MQRDKLLEMIDACRPGGADLGEPEMAQLAEELRRDPELHELYRRSQQFDAAARAAFEDLTVPDGLAERLLVSLAAGGRSAQTSQPVLEHSASIGDVGDAVTPRMLAALEPTGVHAPHRRRFVRWVVGCVTVAAAVLVAILVRVERTQALVSRDDLALSISKTLPDLGSQWRTMDSADPSLLPRSGLLVAPHHWQKYQSPYDGHAVVCDLSRKRGLAYLVVVNRKRDFDVPADGVRLSATAGWAMWAWKDSAHVYILAVYGNQFRLEDFIRPSRDVATNSDSPDTFPQTS